MVEGNKMEQNSFFDTESKVANKEEKLKKKKKKKKKKKIYIYINIY